MRTAFCAAVLSAASAFLSAACDLQRAPAPAIRAALTVADKGENAATTVFGVHDAVYCSVTTGGPHEIARLRAVWRATQVDGLAAGTEVASSDMPYAPDRRMHFWQMPHQQSWKPGAYEVALFLDERLDRTVPFQIDATHHADQAPALLHVRLADDAKGRRQTQVFRPSDTVYCVMLLNHAPPDTKVRTVFSVIDARPLAAGPAREWELAIGTNDLEFHFAGRPALPAGRFKADVYINGAHQKTLEFQVKPDPA